jgi:hypothetical protein
VVTEEKIKGSKATDVDSRQAALWAAVSGGRRRSAVYPSINNRLGLS